MATGTKKPDMLRVRAMTQTKSELRKARKAANSAGHRLTGDLTLPQDNRTDTSEFSETARGYEARQRWAKHYDELNGAPESDNDR